MINLTEKGNSTLVDFGATV